MRYYSLWYYSKHKNIFAALKKNKHLQELGNLIRELRKSRGLSQEQLALQAEVDRSYVGGIERGERNVSFLTLVKIAECLDCDIAKFTKGIPNDE
ncbi:MAG TPA: helix-turn-helix transcriptional regulator [Hanamia sp.]